MSTTVFFVSVEESPISHYNYIVGLTQEGIPINIRLSETQKIIQLDEMLKITSRETDLIVDHLSKIYDEEERVCLD